MAQAILSSGNDVYVSTLVPTGSETANSIFARAGDDDVTGNGYVDFIYGEEGNDFLDGAGNDDVLLGGIGNDELWGSAGDDLLVGQDDNDLLYGGTGVDRMYGGEDNDDYYYFKADGDIDIINDDKSAAGQAGFGGGTDYFVFGDVVAADMRFYHFGDDLYITDVNDVADGFIDTGVILEDFYLGGDNVIERAYGSDNLYYDLTAFV